MTNFIINWMANLVTNLIIKLMVKFAINLIDYFITICLTNYHLNFTSLITILFQCP